MQVNLPESVYTLAEVNHENVPLELSKADIAIMIRKDDPVNAVSSPTKFGEYLAAGLPVIMTDSIGDYSKLVEKNDLGLCFSYDLIRSKESCEKIYSWIQKIDKNITSKKCQNFVRNELMWESATMKWLSSYYNNKNYVQS